MLLLVGEECGLTDAKKKVIEYLCFNPIETHAYLLDGEIDEIQIFIDITYPFFFSPIAAQEIVGWVEKVWLGNENIVARAKIDSGARHSSLHCECKSRINEKGQRVIDLEFKNFRGKSLKLTTRVVRQATIKRHNGRVQLRDVIKLPICLGSVRKEVEVNLIDRSGLNYQLLIGRSFLKKGFLIDPGKTFINKPKCEI